MGELPAAKDSLHEEKSCVDLIAHEAQDLLPEGRGLAAQRVDGQSWQLGHSAAGATMLAISNLLKENELVLALAQNLPCAMSGFPSEVPFRRWSLHCSMEY